MKSEETKNSELQKRVAELERVVGQKQLEIDFLNKLLEIGSSELGFDLKKISTLHHRMVQVAQAQGQNE